MTTRELWLEVMHYGEFDRVPVVHWSQWPETLQRWQSEGLPSDGDVRRYLGVPAHWAGVGADLDLRPAFDQETIEETDEFRIARQADGTIAKLWKNRSSIPHFIDYTFKTADDWPEYKKRLQPDPARIPADIDRRLAAAEASGLPVAIVTASLMGWTRNWMGVENMSYLLYDAPECYAEIVDTLAELTCWALDQIIPRMSRPPDLGFGWEDICGRSGPLVSPHLFEKYVAPGYRRIRSCLEAHGVKLLGVDSDGLVEPLVGHWLDAGVNLQFPIEIGVWDADPFAIHKRFGRELRIVGGLNKLALERGREAIDAEIARRVPHMRYGGYVPMPDHLITPGVPLADYEYYIRRMQALRL
jgi:uroporphyrinogen decarboxylase